MAIGTLKFNLNSHRDENRKSNIGNRIPIAIGTDIIKGRSPDILNISHPLPNPFVWFLILPNFLSFSRKDPKRKHSKPAKEQL